jgi:hypothetical protein
MTTMNDEVSKTNLEVIYIADFIDERDKDLSPFQTRRYSKLALGHIYGYESQPEREIELKRDNLGNNLIKFSTPLPGAYNLEISKDLKNWSNLLQINVEPINYFWLPKKIFYEYQEDKSSEERKFYRAISQTLKEMYDFNNQQNTPISENQEPIKFP